MKGGSHVDCMYFPINWQDYKNFWDWKPANSLKTELHLALEISATIFWIEMWTLKNGFKNERPSYTDEQKLPTPLSWKPNFFNEFIHSYDLCSFSFVVRPSAVNVSGSQLRERFCFISLFSQSKVEGTQSTSGRQNKRVSSHLHTVLELRTEAFSEDF